QEPGVALVARLGVDGCSASGGRTAVEPFTGGPPPRRGDGDADPAGDLGLRVDVLRCAWRFGKIRMPRLECLDQRDCLSEGVAPMQIDHDVDVGAERYA